VTCREIADFLLSYVEGTLDPDVREHFDAHLAVCPDCVRYLAEYTDTISSTRTAFDDDEAAPLPESLVRAILDSRRTGVPR
jgi:anti-sigma factor RsiW